MLYSSGLPGKACTNGRMSTLSSTFATIKPPKMARVRLASSTCEPSVSSRLETWTRQNPVEKNTATTRIFRTSSFALATTPGISSLRRGCQLLRRTEQPLRYFDAVTRVTSLFCWSIVATPHAVAVPLALNLQPHIVPAGTPHWPLSIDATQKPDPTGRPRLLPVPLTATSSSPVPVEPLLQVNVPGELANRTLSAPSHTKLACSTVPLPSTSICSAQESESAGVAIFTFCPTLLVLVVPAAGGGVPAFFCTCDGLTCRPADELCVWARLRAPLNSKTVANVAYLVISGFAIKTPFGKCADSTVFSSFSPQRAGKCTFEYIRKPRATNLLTITGAGSKSVAGQSKKGWNVSRRTQRCKRTYLLGR